MAKFEFDINPGDLDAKAEINIETTESGGRLACYRKTASGLLVIHSLSAKEAEGVRLGILTKSYLKPRDPYYDSILEIENEELAIQLAYSDVGFTTEATITQEGRVRLNRNDRLRRNAGVAPVQARSFHFNLLAADSILGQYGADALDPRISNLGTSPREVSLASRRMAGQILEVVTSAREFEPVTGEFLRAWLSAAR